MTTTSAYRPPVRCSCLEADKGAFAVCRRCGGEYQKTHSTYCDCAVCQPKKASTPDAH